MYMEVPYRKPRVYRVRGLVFHPSLFVDVVRIKGKPAILVVYIEKHARVSTTIPDMDSKRAILTIAVVSLAWLLLFHSKFTDAQVTFSRDWNAGKRSIPPPECSIPLRSATNICQMLVNELRAITNCEVKSLLIGKGEENESASEVFFPQRSG